MYRIGIDIGGTFTDLAAVDDDGTVTIAKTLTTPEDPSTGLLDGLTVLAEAVDLDRESLLSSTERIIHGTTVATNALLEHKGAKVALLTTAGHRDVIEMREGLKDDRYNVRMAPPTPLVERRERIGVNERTRFDGSVEVELASETVDDALDTVDALDVDAVAVCYLHSYANDRHERLTGDAIAERFPEKYVSLSADVLPQIKEFERVWTTVVNAYVGPVVSNYLEKLERKLRTAGYSGDVVVMHSHGGVAPIDETRQLAAGVVLSGPAGGIAAAVRTASLTGEPDLITFDMGGTSTDISLIQNGTPELTGDKTVGIARVSLPTLDIHTLGAGGGSVARVAGQILHVGPESAGAAPGPACYGRGGTDPAVTDANVVLGFLDPENFLGGKVQLDSAAAGKAIDVVADELGTSREHAAAGIAKVVNTNMAEGIRVVSVRRGVDPRRFALVSFGGAAGLHVTEVARQLGITRVVIPNVASVLSAWGMLASDLRFELVRSHVAEADESAVEGIRALLTSMEVTGREKLKDFAGDVVVEGSLDMRYGEQIFEINVGLDGVDIDGEGAIAEIVERFHRRHEALYAYSAPGQEVVVVNVRVTVIGRLPELAAQPLERTAAITRPASRTVFLDDWIEVPVHQLDDLVPGQQIQGPAIFETPTTTAVIRQGDEATVTEAGWLDVRLPT